MIFHNYPNTMPYNIGRNSMGSITTAYNPKDYETKIWELWTRQEIFASEPDSSKKPYTILMPPPNVTSKLHMGHGLGYSIQDLLIRWKRMQGYNACWLPGTDHAGIATQMMVEKSLEDKGTSRKELGRDKFVEACNSWKEHHGGVILEQFKKMGFSCDWNKTAYTMDPGLSKAVRYVFVQLFEEGLIYRGERLVNWDPILQTAISDDEVETKEIPGHLWFFRYQIENSSEFIPIATTRPETMLGDTAVAVNPQDERYSHLIGKKVVLPFSNRKAPIIGDDYVKSEFGTGAVKITPAHDPNDFAIGQRHNLESINIFNDDASCNKNTPLEFQGLNRFEARKKIIQGLKDLNLFDEEKSYKHSVPHSERSKAIIEPKLSKQWYVKMSEMAGEAAKVARDEELTFYPDNWKKTYLYWLDNIQDWCISRQLWWGHRIPIWYCQSEGCNGVTTGMEDPSTCAKCGSSDLLQDEDVLDTWFSSWLWPLSPFGWPDNSDQLDYYYPTNTLVTGAEIIFLWVARMVMVGKKYLGKVPFRDIYFNAIVCDKKGRKFSKTLGNGIDPLDVIENYGADAVRFTAISLAPLGGRVRMDISDFENGSKFINKLWNATRFLLGQCPDNFTPKTIENISLNLHQKWLIHELDTTSKKINKFLEDYRVNDAVSCIYHFIWGTFCDWAIEISKESLQKDGDGKVDSLSVLIYTLDDALRLAHPIIPFVTEELWQKLPKPQGKRTSSCLATEAFPRGDNPRFGEEALRWQSMIDLISAARSTRTQAGIPHSTKLTLYVKSSERVKQTIEDSQSTIKRLAGLDDLNFTQTSLDKKCLTAVKKDFTLYIPAEGLIDLDKELSRLANEEKRISKIVLGLEKKLGNANFVEKAPKDIITETQEKLATMQAQWDEIKANLSSLGC